MLEKKKIPAPSSAKTKIATSTSARPHKNLLGYAVNVQLQPLDISAAHPTTGWALPQPIRDRMLLNKGSWKRRYFGLYIEALSTSDAALWQPLGHPSSSSPSKVVGPPPHVSVWYCPSVLIGEGASSKVFLGVDNLGRPVAVKLYSEEACAVIASRGGSDGYFSEAHKLASQSETHEGLVKYVTHTLGGQYP